MKPDSTDGATEIQQTEYFVFLSEASRLLIKTVSCYSQKDSKVPLMKSITTLPSKQQLCKKREQNVVIKMTPNAILLYVWGSALFSLDCSSFLLQNMGKNIEKHSLKLHQERETSMGYLHQTLPFRLLRNQEKWTRNSMSPRRDRQRTSMKQGLLIQHEQRSYKLIELEAVCAWRAWLCAMCFG